MTLLARAASVRGTKVVSKVRLHSNFRFALSVCRACRALLISITTVACCFPGAAIGQAPLAPANGSGEAFLVPGSHTEIMITFEYNAAAPTGPMYANYVYDPKAVVVLDHTGKPTDISAVHHRRVNFTARLNPRPTNSLVDSRMEITKLVLQPTEAQPGSAVEWDPLESTCRHASLSIL